MTHRRSSSSKISRKSRRKTKTEKKHNKWFQRGCQNKSARKGGQNGQNGQRGGSGILGGNAWAASDIRPVSGAEGPAAAPAIIPPSDTVAAGHSQKGGNSGNHYVFNPNPLPPPQSSNALVEFANKMSGGSGSGKHRRQKQRGSHKSRKGIKLACNRNRNRKHSQQRGGATEYLPMTASNIVRSIGDGVGGFINALQGSPTPYNSSDPTMQPIGNTSQLK
jgi:hypothetical protein